MDAEDIFAGINPWANVVEEEPMSVRSHPAGDAIVIVVSGEFDMAGAPDFSLCAYDCLKRSSHLVLDLDSVSFLDLSGLASILEVYREAQAVDGRVSIRAASAQVRRVFEVSGLVGLLPSTGA